MFTVGPDYPSDVQEAIDEYREKHRENPLKAEWWLYEELNANEAKRFIQEGLHENLQDAEIDKQDIAIDAGLLFTNIKKKLIKFGKGIATNTSKIIFDGFQRYYVTQNEKEYRFHVEDDKMNASKLFTFDGYTLALHSTEKGKKAPVVEGKEAIEQLRNIAKLLPR